MPNVFSSINYFRNCGSIISGSGLSKGEDSIGGEMYRESRASLDFIKGARELIRELDKDYLRFKVRLLEASPGTSQKYSRFRLAVGLGPSNSYYFYVPIIMSGIQFEVDYKDIMKRLRNGEWPY